MTNPESNEPRAADGAEGAFVSFCRHLAPHLEVVSVSQPEARLAHSNVVGLCPDVETAREAVLSLESIEDDDARLGLVVMAPPDDGLDRGRRTDPERVAGTVFKRVVLGGLAGAAVGAIVFGVVGYLVGGWSAALGAALGGVVLVGPIGAIWTTFAGFGGSDAYRQTYVDPEIDSLGVVLLPITGPRTHDDALQQLSAIEGVTVLDVDQHGTITSEPPRRASA